MCSFSSVAYKYYYICYVMGTPVSIYTQIGIILLVALSAKNGILIVEFARDFRAQGNSIDLGEVVGRDIGRHADGDA